MRLKYGYIMTKYPKKIWCKMFRTLEEADGLQTWEPIRPDDSACCGSGMWTNIRDSTYRLSMDLTNLSHYRIISKFNS